MDSGIVWTVLEWAWVALLGFFVHIYRQITGLETQQKLLKQNQDHLGELREADHKADDAYRDSIRSLIAEHNKTVMDRIDRLEVTIRNGR